MDYTLLQRRRHIAGNMRDWHTRLKAKQIDHFYFLTLIPPLLTHCCLFSSTSTPVCLCEGAFCRFLLYGCVCIYMCIIFCKYVVPLRDCLQGVQLTVLHSLLQKLADSFFESLLPPNLFFKPACITAQQIQMPLFISHPEIFSAESTELYFWPFF